MSVALGPIPLAVLSRYGPAVAGLRWVSLGPAGGLSGAVLWRGDDPAGTPRFALKAWPAGTLPERVAFVHGLMRRAAHLPFVPPILTTTEGSTCVVEAGRVWDLCRWMPGAADFRQNPSTVRLANACAALGALHRAWMPATANLAPCPAVVRRLHAVVQVRQFRHLFVRPPRLGHPGLDAALGRAAAVVLRLAPAAEAALRPWAGRPVRVQPCHGDPRHDHVLFTGDAVTGLVDYGAAKADHPAADLARLLGELAGDDDGRFAAGLAAHAAAGGPPEPAPGFARLLDRTGVVGALAGWVVRAAGGHPDPAGAAARVAALAARAESFSTA